MRRAWFWLRWVARDLRSRWRRGFERLYQRRFGQRCLPGGNLHRRRKLSFGWWGLLRRGGWFKRGLRRRFNFGQRSLFYRSAFGRHWFNGGNARHKLYWSRRQFRRGGWFERGFRRRLNFG